MKHTLYGLLYKNLIRRRGSASRFLLTSTLMISFSGMAPHVLANEAPTSRQLAHHQISIPADEHRFSNLAVFKPEFEQTETIKHVQQTELPPLSNDLALSEKYMSKWLDGVEATRSRNERRLKLRREDLQEDLDRFERLDLIRDEVSVEFDDTVISPVIFDGSVETLLAVTVTNNSPKTISRPNVIVTYDPLRSGALKTQLWRDLNPELIIDAESEAELSPGQEAVFHLKIKMYIPEEMSDLPSGNWSPVMRGFNVKDGKNANFSGMSELEKTIARQKEIIESCEALLGKFDGFIDDAKGRIAALYEPEAEPDYEKFPSLACYP